MLRRISADVVEGFARHRLLTYASAIAYQVLSALIPFALFALALASIVGAQGVWTDHLRPDIRSSASVEVFDVVDKTVEQILHHQQVFWVTFGLLVVLWELGGAVRATMEALDNIYGARRKRSRTEKYVTSTWLSAAVGALWLLALVVVATVAGVLTGPLGHIARDVLAAGVLNAATW